MSIIDKFNYYWFMRTVDSIIDSTDDNEAEPEFIDDWLNVCEWLRPSNEIVSVGE